MQGRDIKEVFAELERIFEPALKLIRDKTGLTSYIIPAEGIADPEAYFDDLIKAAYAKA